MRALLDSVLTSRYKHTVILASVGMLYLAHLSSVHMLLTKTVLSGNVGLSLVYACNVWQPLCKRDQWQGVIARSVHKEQMHSGSQRVAPLLPPQMQSYFSSHSIYMNSAGLGMGIVAPPWHRVRKQSRQTAASSTPSMTWQNASALWQSVWATAWGAPQGPCTRSTLLPLLVSSA